MHVVRGMVDACMRHEYSLDGNMRGLCSLGRMCVWLDKLSWYVYVCHGMSWYVYVCACMCPVVKGYKNKNELLFDCAAILGIQLYPADTATSSGQDDANDSASFDSTQVRYGLAKT